MGDPARVAVVTGASSGLGRGLALALAGEGWRVALLARRRERLEVAADEIRAGGGTALALPVDVTDRAAVHTGVREAETRLGPIGLLVANAGISEGVRGGELDAERVRRIFEVNVLGTVHAVEAVLPGMRARGSGHILGVSSLAGYRGLPTAPAYSGSKAAMSAFLEGLRADLRGTGVAVTVAHPGYVRTPMTEGNPHPMPFLMELDDAVRILMRAVRKRPGSLAFPWPLALLVRAGRLLPSAWYDALVARVSGSRRRAGEPDSP